MSILDVSKRNGIRKKLKPRRVQVADGALLWCLPVNPYDPSESLDVFLSQVGDASFAKGRDDQALMRLIFLATLMAFLSGPRQDRLAFLLQPASVVTNLGNRMLFLLFRVAG